MGARGWWGISLFPSLPFPPPILLSFPPPFPSQVWDEGFCFATFCLHDDVAAHQKSKTTGSLANGLELPKVSHCKYFLFINWLSLILCSHNRNMTNIKGDYLNTNLNYSRHSLENIYGDFFNSRRKKKNLGGKWEVGYKEIGWHSRWP